MSDNIAFALLTLGIAFVAAMTVAMITAMLSLAAGSGLPGALMHAGAALGGTLAVEVVIIGLLLNL